MAINAAFLLDLLQIPVTTPGILVSPVPPPPPTVAPIATAPAVETPAPNGQENKGAAISSSTAAPVFYMEGLKIQPWPHQRRGFLACIESIKKYRACLLAAEMGVGKTFIATMIGLHAMTVIEPGRRRVLILCPLRVLGSWRVQLEQYLGVDYILTLLDDSKSVAKRCEMLRRDLELAQVTGRFHFVAINYDSYWREPIDDLLVASEWAAVIYDESHKLKSPGAKASQMARRLFTRCAVRVLATGTPMAHSPLDAFGQMRAACPSVFGTNYIAFKQRYALWAGPNNRIRVGFQNLDELEARLAPLTWRATKEEVLPDLPEQTEVEYDTELNSDAAKIYRSLEKEMVADIAGRQISAANVLTKILRLQQITGGSVPDDEGRYHIVDTSKRDLLAEVIEDLGPAPFVVFCKFRSDIDAAHEACRMAGVESKELSGRFNQLEEWQAGQGQGIIVQMQSGSVGITLVRASTAIYYSLTCSLAEWDQSQARIHRPGQKNACTFVYLTVKGSIDQKILRALRGRQEVIEGIMTNIQQQGSK